MKRPHTLQIYFAIFQQQLRGLSLVEGSVVGNKIFGGRKIERKKVKCKNCDLAAKVFAQRFLIWIITITNCRNTNVQRAKEGEG